MMHIQFAHPVILDSIEECERRIKIYIVERDEYLKRCKHYEELIIGNQIMLNLLKGFPIKAEEVEV
jgi:hypothetical protein